MSDAIFGNGMSMPGGEDICIQTDEKGFPYLKGSTLKGIFREELINYLDWCGINEGEAAQTVTRLMTEGGIIFSDVTLDGRVIDAVNAQNPTKQEVIEMFSYIREFTRLENGLAKDGSLRSARCIKQNLNFYSTCLCDKKDEELTTDVLKMIKWIGSMRNRGFGKVSIEVEEINE
jgi:CRISPR/Cas system CSM-associated protein Csm3 (group 7 of RAMP superfamily)